MPRVQRFGTTHAAVVDALEAVPLLLPYVRLHVNPLVYCLLERRSIRVGDHHLFVSQLAGRPLDEMRLRPHSGSELTVYLAPVSFTAEEAEMYRVLRTDGLDPKAAETATKLL